MYVCMYVILDLGEDGWRLIEGGGGAYLIVPKSLSDMIGYFVIYVCVRPSEVSERCCVS